jgi:DNA-binding MarR family transcriptional regulator
VPASNLPPSPSDVASRLRVAVARIDRLLGREVLRSDLTRTQFSVLATLAREGEQRLSALGEREGLNPTMLSRVVAALERSGWVERAPDPDDGRAALVSATAAGRALHARLRRERSALVEEWLTGLANDDAGRLVAALPLLEGLADHLVEHASARAAAAPRARVGAP